ncbi:hypothetical protein [Falsiroseomonas sp. HW251]|uniref:hypothetical protein n=1 Tax=Falsiroseomonas sp. HW251 TaxID=3390998 RepID=UPI003D313710
MLFAVLQHGSHGVQRDRKRGSDLLGRLYSVYRRDLRGALRFEQFMQQQLAVDLMAEFVPADQQRQREILADVLFLAAEDFEKDEDV